MISFIFYIGMMAFYKKSAFYEKQNMIKDFIPLNLKDLSGNDERVLLENNEKDLSNIIRIYQTDKMIRLLSSHTINNDKKLQLIENNIISKIQETNVFEGGLMDDWNFE